MNFHVFIHCLNYDINNVTGLKNALRDFCLSPYIQPFFEAISRSGSTEDKQFVGQHTNSFVKKFIEFIQSEEGKVLKNKITGENYESTLKFTVITKFSDQINKLQHAIWEVGNKVLKQEYTKALESLDSSQWISFYEFCQKVMGSADKNQTITFHQWHSYLYYIATKLTLFIQHPLYSKNKEQAELLYDNLIKLMQTAGDTKQKYNQLSKSFNTAYIQYFDEIKKHSELKRLVQIAEQVDEKKISPNQLKVKKIAFGLFDNIEKKHIKKRNEFEKNLVNAFDTLRSFANQNTPDSFLQSDTKTNTDIRNLLNYWEVNWPRYQNRLSDIQKIESVATLTEKPYETLYRYICKEEMQSLIKYKAFNQHPTKSLEREKWFFISTASPGNNVQHEFLCEIKVAKGTIESLEKLKKQDGCFAAVVSKENEKDCIGIHEDALPAFNKLIHQVIIKQTKDLTAVVSNVLFEQNSVDSITQKMDNLPSMVKKAPILHLKNHQGKYQETNKQLNNVKKVNQKKNKK